MRKRDATPEKRRASFVAPMLLQSSAKLPEDDAWLIELKLDGFRAIAFKTGGKVHLRSRNNKDFNGRYPAIVRGLSNMPDETVLDGEIVALDESGRPSFNVLQNYGSSDAPTRTFLVSNKSDHLTLVLIEGQCPGVSVIDKRSGNRRRGQHLWNARSSRPLPATV